MTVRVMILTEGYPWRDNFAGAFHHAQFGLLAAQPDLDVTVVAPMPWVPKQLAARNVRWRRYAEVPAVQHDNGLTVLRPRYPALPRENRWFWPDLARYVALRFAHLQKPDVIQSYFAIPTGATARLLARLWRVPHVAGMLGDDVNIYPTYNARNRGLLGDVLRDAAFAFANGPALAAKAQELTGIAVDMISIGASAQRFEGLPDRVEARRRLGLPPDGKIALYVGRLVQDKGIRELAAALDVLGPDVTVVTVGEGPCAPLLAGRPNAIGLGPRSGEDVSLAMRAADIMVHPSYYEGLPTVLVEAAFADLPIVTTDARGCIDLARDGRALMAPVGDAAALAAAITESFAQPIAARERAEAMRKHCAEHYNLEKNAARLAALYRDLAGRTPH